jgi:hypothetical protein
MTYELRQLTELDFSKVCDDYQEFENYIYEFKYAIRMWGLKNVSWAVDVDNNSYLLINPQITGSYTDFNVNFVFYFSGRPYRVKLMEFFSNKVWLNLDDIDSESTKNKIKDELTKVFAVYGCFGLLDQQSFKNVSLIPDFVN